jgi:hypothetical protein
MTDEDLIRRGPASALRTDDAYLAAAYKLAPQLLARSEVAEEACNNNVTELECVAKLLREARTRMEAAEAECERLRKELEEKP